SECTGDNIFVVRDGRLITPSASAGILHGVTRRFVMEELGPELGHVVEERPMKLDDILGADEVFLTGTAAEIIGVIRIDEHKIGCGVVGPVTRALEAEFRRRVSSNAPED
ncbi:MAG: aminotransferase class IV, partial [Vicinamibacterales bacterium]